MRAPIGEQATALVFGAGSGLHLVRLTDAPTLLAADLADGPLRVVAFHTLHLTATNVGDPNVVRLSPSGPVLQLRRERAQQRL